MSWIRAQLAPLTTMDYRIDWHAVDWPSVAVKAVGGGLALVTAAVGAGACYLHYKHQQLAGIPGPPRDSWLMGHAKTWGTLMADGEKTFGEALLELHEKYGETIVIWFLSYPVISTIDTLAVKDLLVNGVPAKEKWLFSIFGTRFLGRSIAFETDLEAWAMRRKLMMPMFHRNALREYMDTFNSSTDRIINTIKTMADGKTVVPMMDLLNWGTLDMMASMACGIDVNMLNDQSSELAKATLKMHEGLAKAMNDPTWALTMRGDTKHKQEVKEAIQYIRDTGHESFEKRRQALINGGKLDKAFGDFIKYSADKYGDTIVDYMKQELKGEDLEVQLDDFMGTFMGFETTGSLVSFLVMELGRQPEILSRLQSEVADIVGTNETITFNDLAQMEYLTQVVKEGLRLSPSAEITVRKIVKESPKVAGHTLPAGTQVMVNLLGMARYSKYHSDPLTFDPDRFHGDSPEKPSTYHYMPFSMGPRNCAGQMFAMNLMKIRLAKLVQNFEWQNHPDESFKLSQGISRRPKDGAKVMVTLRS